ncbi:MAG: TRAP transporter small permease [Desulfovibrio sp.]|nr:TRAP transporter small permease [Desulfovibrio sp.]
MFLRWINVFEAVVVPVVVALMSIVTIAQVFFRYVVAYSLDWPEELGRYLFIVSIYLGAGYAERFDRHLAVTVLRESKNPYLSKIGRLAGSFFTVIFSVIMVTWGIQMTFFVYETQQIAPAMGFPMFFVYAVIPLGAFLMGIHASVRLGEEMGILRRQPRT